MQVNYKKLIELLLIAIISTAFTITALFSEKFLRKILYYVINKNGSVTDLFEFIIFKHSLKFGLGERIEQVPCDLPPCAFWAQWHEWTPCTVTCGEGVKHRTRICQYGIECEGPNEVIDQCYFLLFVCLHIYLNIYIRSISHIVLHRIISCDIVSHIGFCCGKRSAGVFEI